MTHVHCQCPACRFERFLNRSWLGMAVVFIGLLLLLLTILFSLPGRARAAGEHGHLEPEPDKHGELEGTLGPRQSRYTPADVHAALDRASPRARCVVRYEVGGRGYDPYAVGSQGERGPVQLHPRGLLALYTRWSNGAAPENPYTAIPFLDWALAQGYAAHWSPVRRGLC